MLIWKTKREMKEIQPRQQKQMAHLRSVWSWVRIQFEDLIKPRTFLPLKVLLPVAPGIQSRSLSLFINILPTFDRFSLSVSVRRTANRKETTCSTVLPRACSVWSLSFDATLREQTEICQDCENMTLCKAPELAMKCQALYWICLIHWGASELQSSHHLAAMPSPVRVTIVPRHSGVAVYSLV